jgi:hypothetical protein
MNTRLILAILCSTALLQGCASFFASLFGQSRFNPTLIEIYTQAAPLPPGRTTSIAAACPAGKPLFGGGFRVVGSGSNGVIVRSSYPSPGAWAVEARSYEPAGKDVSLIAVAYCYARQQTAPITTSIISESKGAATETWNLSAACGPGTALTGGGYRRTQDPPSDNDQLNNGGVLGSYPNASASGTGPVRWVVEVHDHLHQQRSYDAFAICVTGPLGQAIIAQAEFAPPTNAGIHSGEVRARCSQNAFTTGAGFLFGVTGLGQAHTASSVLAQEDSLSGELVFDMQLVSPPPQALASCLNVL